MARIALAEDDATMVQLLSTLLRMDGFDVESVGSEADVAAAVERVAPDALVLDMHLATQSGLEVLDALRLSNSARALPIIMISGLNVKDDCLARGANDFLQKPFMPEDLIRVLRTNLAHPHLGDRNQDSYSA